MDSIHPMPKTRRSVSYTLNFNFYSSMIVGLNEIAYVEEPDRLGVASSGLDLLQLIRGLDLGRRHCPLVYTSLDNLWGNLMLATRCYYFVGACREVWNDRWVKEKPPDWSFRLHGAMRRSHKVQRFQMRGKVDTPLTFIDSDSWFVFAGNVRVLGSKPPEEGGNDEDTSWPLVPEVPTGAITRRSKAKSLKIKFNAYVQAFMDGLVAEEQLVAEQLGGTEGGGSNTFDVDCLGVGSFAGLSTLSLKGVWTLFSQEGEELAPPTLH